MADKGSGGRGHQEPQFPTPMAFDLTAFLDASRPALHAMAEMNAKVYENVAAFNKEWVGFVNKRLKEDFAVPQQLAACKTFEDMYTVYTGYMQRAAEQYRTELEQMSKFGQSIASDTIGKMQEQSGRMQRELR
jgi:hypothetical protein